MRLKFWLIAAISLAFIWLLISHKQKPAQIQQHLPIKSVRVYNSESKPKELSLVLRGYTSAWRFTLLRARTEGTVTSLLVDRGAFVKTNDLLVKLSQDDRKEKLNEAAAKINLKNIEYKATKTLHDSSFESDAMLALKQSELNTALSNKKTAALSIEYSQIKAPFTGVVCDKFIEIGDLVKSGDKILSIAELNPLRVIVFCTEKDMPFIKQNMKTKVKIENVTIDGEIFSVSPVADSKTRMYRVDVKIPNNKFADGMSSEVSILGNTIKAHKIISSAISLSDDGLSGVKIINEKGLVKFIPVNIVSIDQNFSWLTGIPEKSNVIITGQDFLSDGDKPEIEITSQCMR